jgi:hypothetical protein
VGASAHADRARDGHRRASAAALARAVARRGEMGSRRLGVCVLVASQLAAGGAAFAAPPLPPVLLSPDSPPPSSTFPDASNTGIPAGVTLTPSGSLTIRTAGTVIDSLDVNGTIFIDANNVTIRRSRVRGSGTMYVIRSNFGRSGIVIEDNEVDGLGNANYAVAGEGMTVRRNNISNAENGVITWGDSTIEDNYVHNLKCGSVCGGDPHYDGIQLDGGYANVTIRHNTVNLDEWTQTSAIMLDNYFGGLDNILVENNLLIGAGYTCYADASFNSNPINATYRNNQLLPCQGTVGSNGCSSTTGWYWGAHLIRGPGTVVWQGNVDHLTGNPIP